MRVNTSQIRAYVREDSLRAARTGAVVDVKTPPVPAPVSGAPSLRETGSLQSVLTPEESGFIASLFPEPKDREGIAGAGRVYSQLGRATPPGAASGIRLDFKA